MIYIAHRLQLTQDQQPASIVIDPANVTCDKVHIVNVWGYVQSGLLYYSIGSLWKYIECITTMHTSVPVGVMQFPSKSSRTTDEY